VPLPLWRGPPAELESAQSIFTHLHGKLVT
jgi:hypothetical protein